MKPPPVDFMPLVNELRIRGEVLKNERAEYGEQMVSTLSAQLAVESASGWRSVIRHAMPGRYARPTRSRPIEHLADQASTSSRKRCIT